MNLEVLYKKPVGIFGAGVTGQAVGKFLESKKIPYIIYAEGVSSKQQSLLEFNITAARQHALIIYSPGFYYNHPWLEIARTEGVICLAEVDFAFLNWPGKMIGITGTNGKTTLTQFITQSLNLLNIEAVVVGNIGRPFIDICYPEFYKALAVCELSSNQLEAIQYLSVDIAIWTTFSENHLERHGNLQNYFKAKYSLIQKMRGELILIGESVYEFDRVVFEGVYFSDLPQKVVKIIRKEDPLKIQLQQSSPFYYGPQMLNIRFAHTLFQCLNYSLPSLECSANNFQLSPHRFQKIHTLQTISFWNDSKSTTFESTLAALSYFDKKVYWIGGGKSKGGDIGKFTRAVMKYVKKAYLIGETATEIYKIIYELGGEVELCGTVEEAVKQAYVDAGEGDNILFSPGFASLDMFAGYEDRGNCFKKVVFSLKNDRNALECVQYF